MLRMQVRLYVMRGLGLAAMDEGWNGRPGASDPYLRAICGKQASYQSHFKKIKGILGCSFITFKKF